MAPIWTGTLGRVPQTPTPKWLLDMQSWPTLDEIDKDWLRRYDDDSGFHRKGFELPDCSLLAFSSFLLHGMPWNEPDSHPVKRRVLCHRCETLSVAFFKPGVKIPEIRTGSKGCCAHGVPSVSFVYCTDNASGACKTGAGAAWKKQKSLLESLKLRSVESSASFIFDRNTPSRRLVSLGDKFFLGSDLGLNHRAYLSWRLLWHFVVFRKDYDRIPKFLLPIAADSTIDQVQMWGDAENDHYLYTRMLLTKADLVHIYGQQPASIRYMLNH